MKIDLSGSVKIATRESYGNALVELGEKHPELVVLDADPLTVNPQTIKDIKVLGTVRKGDLVYNNGIG